jgi:hypothetical protein
MSWIDKKLNHKIWVHEDGILGGSEVYFMNNAEARRRCQMLVIVIVALFTLISKNNGGQ